MGRLDLLSHQKRDHAQVQEMKKVLNLTRDEMAAWTAMASQGDIEIEVTDPERYLLKFRSVR